MLHDSIADAKHRLRPEAKRRRDAIAPAARAAAEAAVADRFIAMLAASPARTVAGYWPLGGELDIRPLMMRIRAEAGRRVALPVVEKLDSPLGFRLWEDDAPPPLRGLAGALEPDPMLARRAAPDLVIVPCLAFDRRGHRLGFGKGYYDRTLAFLRGVKEIEAVAIAFAAQEVAEVPADRNDQPLDWILTEEGAIRPAMKGRAR